MNRGSRGYRGGSRGGTSYRGGGYRGSSDHHGGGGGSSYNNRDNSRNRYSGGGGSSYDSRGSSRYDANRYTRQDTRPGAHYNKRNDSYKDTRGERRSPDRKRPRTDHTSQGGRRDYSTGAGGGGGGDYHRRDGSGGGSSSRYHDGSSSYDKRGGNDHHSSAGAGGSAGTSGGNAGREHRFDNRSSSRGRGGISDKSRDTMGPPRSMGPPRGTRGPPMRSTGPLRSAINPMIRRGPGISMRGRGGLINNRFRNDGRRGIITSRFNTRRDINPMRRRYPPIRHDVMGRINKRTDIRPVSRKALIMRALAAAKELDDDDDQTTENEEDDDDDKDTTGAEGDDSKSNLKELDEDDDGDKTEKEEDDEDHNAAEDQGDEDKGGDKTSKDADDTEGGDDTKDGAATPKKAVKKPASATPTSKTKGSPADKSEKKETRITTRYRTSSYIKLNCVQCATRCVTFKEYHQHLFLGRHKAAMRRLAGKTRDKLMEMRQKQRIAQKEEDQKVDESSEQKSSYCPLCQLNFRQPKTVHQKSDGHKEMKRFLMPYCATCKIGFKSPMAYETHRASLEHLKFKARVERYANKEDEDAGTEIDLENFTTVDEVGNVDDPTDSSKDNTSTPKKTEDNQSAGQPGTDNEEDDSDDADTDALIGADNIKLIQVNYCNLCKMYLPMKNDPDKELRRHCKSRIHLRLYIRQREDMKLRERAQRIHKKKLTDGKAKKEAKPADKDTSTAEAEETVKQGVKQEKKEGGADAENKDTSEDQMWEVVDNDLGDLLREVGGPGEDAEEEEDDEKTSSERYDKFKHTEKNGVEQSSVHEDEEELPSTEKKIAPKKAAANGEANGADKEVKAEA